MEGSVKVIIRREKKGKRNEVVREKEEITDGESRDLKEYKRNDKERWKTKVKKEKL